MSPPPTSQSGTQPHEIAWSGRLSEEQVIARYDARKYSAIYDEADLDLIDRIWREREQSAALSGRNVYNSSIFRLAAHRQRSDGNLVLDLGLTDYREYVATRSPEVALPRANPIGTCVVPITSDGLIPMGRRAQSAEVNPGKFFTFGGFFDARLDLTDDGPSIFSCIRREVREEIGIDLDHGNLALIGVVLDRVNIHPEMSFVAEISLSAAEVEARPWTSELDELTFVPAQHCSEFVHDNRSDITPTLIGALEILIQ